MRKGRVRERPAKRKNVEGRGTARFEIVVSVASRLSAFVARLAEQSQFPGRPDERKRILEKGLGKVSPVSGAEKESETNPIAGPGPETSSTKL